MKTWPIYVAMQNATAYGAGIASPHTDDQHALMAAGYFERLGRWRPEAHGLIIGPGGAGEVQALMSALPAPLCVLVGHEPEVGVVRAACPSAVVALGDMHDMSYQSGLFAAVYAANVLEHALAPYCALMEIRRVLRIGGVAYLVMPAFDGPDGGRGPYHLHCLDPKTWGELLRKAGLVLADVIHVAGTLDSTVSYTHYRCVAGPLDPPHDRVMQELITFRAGAP